MGQVGKIREGASGVRVSYDKDLDALYIRLREGGYAFSEEVNQNTIIDLDAGGRIMAVEILDVSDFFGKKLLQKTLRAEAARVT